MPAKPGFSQKSGLRRLLAVSGDGSHVIVKIRNKHPKAIVGIGNSPAISPLPFQSCAKSAGFSGGLRLEVGDEYVLEEFAGSEEEALAQRAEVVSVGAGDSLDESVVAQAA